MEAQVTASQPTIKRLWQQLVKSKIAHQAAVIEAIGQPVIPIRALIAEVKSGDPDNIEAQAARRYWPMVFGSDFRRDQGAGGVNALLNYGYMIIRSTVARYIMAAGLHPSFGLHHSNDFNAMRLVDDVMEPFRPHVDFAVYNLKKMGLEEVTPDSFDYFSDIIPYSRRRCFKSSTPKEGVAAEDIGTVATVSFLTAFAKAGMIKKLPRVSAL